MPPSAPSQVMLTPHGIPPSPPSDPATTLASRPTLIYWPAVHTAGFLAVLSLAGLCVWVASRPHSHTVTPQAASEPLVKVGEKPPVAPTAAPPPKTEPRQQVGLPTKQKISSPISVVAKKPPQRTPAKVFAKPVVDLPSPAKPTSVKSKPAVAHGAGQTYGTSVTFLSSPDEAAEQARQEQKLLFVLHVSGNFEDSCFT